MGIIIKFILRNIREKKLRTLLITISVAAACGLFFASYGVSDSYKSAYISMLKSYYGSADISIYAQQKSPSLFFRTDKLDFVRDKIEYSVGEMDGSGGYEASRYEVVNVSLRGLEYDDLMLMNPINLIHQLSLKPFTGNKIIISEKMSAKYKLGVGEKIKIKIGNVNHIFMIVGIAQQSSVFKMESEEMTAVVPRDAMQDIYMAKGRVSSAFIKIRDTENKQQVMNEISRYYKDYDVKETISQREIDSDLQTTKLTFLMMLTVVLVMSIFIIYTAFKVIIMERMPIIGTFRSIGATKFSTNLVLVIESIVYGILGGIIGDALGIGILYIIGVLMNPYKKYLKPVLEYRPELLLQAFLFGVVVSFISALFPILGVSKIPVKDIVLNKTEKTIKRGKWRFTIGIVLLIISVSVPIRLSLNTSATLIIDMAAIIIIIISVIMIIPYLNTIFVKLFEKVYGLIFGNVGVLAAKNLRDNKSILNNICLLSIGISALLMINVVSFSASEEVSKAYGAWSADVVIQTRAGAAAKNTVDESSIRAVDGVMSTAAISSIYNVGVDISNSSNNRIMDIDSIDTRKFSDFINVEFVSKTKGIPSNFDDDRNILITSQLRARFDKEEGDTIVLNTNSGKKSYRVVGIINTIMQNGDYAFIPERYMKSDFKVRNYSRIFIKTYKDSDYVAELLKEKFKGRRYVISTLKKMEEENAKANEDMMRQLRAFPFISIIIGAFGIVNNFIISFIERKRSFAVLSSMGMSKIQKLGMVFIEALSVGLIGGIMGIATGFTVTSIIPYILRTMELPIPMHYTGSLFAVCMVLGVGITLISSITPALKSSRMNIIEAIKYE